MPRMTLVHAQLQVSYLGVCNAGRDFNFSTHWPVLFQWRLLLVAEEAVVVAVAVVGIGVVVVGKVVLLQNPLSRGVRTLAG